MKLFISSTAIFLACAQTLALPNGFVYLADYAPSIQQDMRYATSNNFVGEPIDGYVAPKCILTRPAAIALSNIQQSLKPKGLGLRVFDCYRPQRAVNHFVHWSKDISDQKMKRDYYPKVNKRDFFKRGYVAKKSGHTRGSTVDLTLIHLKTNKALDMGTHFDFMDRRSHPLLRSTVTPQQFQNRQLLRDIMHKHGFKPLLTEWWHFTLKNEPYPNRYFDFPVK